MILKLLFDTIIINNNFVDPVYISYSNVIIDKNNGNILYKFSDQIITNFFKFSLEFGYYDYIDIYIPKTKTFKKKNHRRIYNIYLYLNLSVIIGDRGMTRQYNQKLAYYLSILQIKTIKNKKNYHIDEDSISHFINYREKNKMQFMPWHYYPLDNSHIYDLRNKRPITVGHNTKIFFRRTGGIIETNNVARLINENFRIGNAMLDTLIILPTNMTKLWYPNNSVAVDYQILTYDKLMSMDILSINIMSDSEYKGVKKIIVHECHMEFLSAIKRFANVIGCKCIWFINSLPLRYYFASTGTPIKLTVNDLDHISGLWLNLSPNEKRRHKYDIIKMLLSGFNQYYTIINYKNDMTNIKSLNIPLVPLEKHIRDIFIKYYDNWKDKLTNVSSNTYSVSTIEKNHLIETKIYDAILTMATSIVDTSSVSKFFEYGIKNVLHKIKNSGIIKCPSTQNILNSIINNYNRYLTGNIYNLIKDNCCPICYSDENIKTELICGHFVCLDCIMHTISNTGKCPICNEFINVYKIAIIRESIEKHNSYIYSYLKNLNYDTVILTDMRAFVNIANNNEYNVRIININRFKFVDKIKKLNQVNNIVVFTTPDRIMTTKLRDQIDKIINYFMLFNDRPKITRVEINML